MEDLKGVVTSVVEGVTPVVARGYMKNIDVGYLSSREVEIFAVSIPRPGLTLGVELSSSQS